MSVELTSDPKTQPDSRGRRLESWKEIAAYLKRDVTTVRRWEKREGLPVYRLQHSKLGSIFAYTSELDAWRDRQTPEGATDAPNADADHQPTRIRHVRRWLVLGVVAVVGLLVATYLSTRSRAFNVTEEDTVVVADFANSTGDSVFDGALRQGLSVQLQQSPFLRIVSDQRIRETLRLMGKPQDAHLGPEIAKDLCVRVGSKAYIAGSITSFGNNYVIGLQAVNCLTGDLLAQEQVQEPGKQKVLDGLSRAAGKLRETLGESISSVQKFDTPLAQATTPSLEALKSFSLGVKALNRGDYTASVTALQRAIVLDPNFALAYSGLSANYTNLGESPLAIENAKKAYELRERVTELEKFAIESNYQTIVTGDLEKARQTEELWALTYPRNADPHFSLGNIYNNLGKHEKALVEARESLRLGSHESLDYAYLAFAYSLAGHLKEARATAEEALAKNLESPVLRMTIYPLAFLQDDTVGMAEQVAWAAGKSGVEDVLMVMEADTAGYTGQLRKAREFSRRAVESAERAEKKEAAASYEADGALREALFGNPDQARRRAVAALYLSRGRDVQFGAALALAFAGDAARAEELADELAKRFPGDTIVSFNYLPTIRSQVALDRNDAATAIEALRATAPYELGAQGNGGFDISLYPVYVHGRAHLAARRGHEAAVEFQKILDYRGVVGNEPIGALVHLDLARALILQGDTIKGTAAYQDFLSLWKDADRDVPILKQARAEYARLQ